MFEVLRIHGLFWHPFTHNLSTANLALNVLVYLYVAIQHIRFAMQLPGSEFLRALHELCHWYVALAVPFHQEFVFAGYSGTNLSLAIRTSFISPQLALESKS